MLALSERVWHIPQFLQPEQCQQLLGLALQHGFVPAQVRAASGTRAMPMVRNNLRAQLPSPEWVSVLWQGFLAHDLPDIDGRQACGLPRDLRFYQYLPEQRFKMHKDGPWLEEGLRSELTLLVYDAELAARQPHIPDLSASRVGTGREMFSALREKLSGAEQGATCITF